jgi:hypothetical protein
LKSLTVSVLQDKFNEILGIKSLKNPSYAHRLMKQLLASSTKPHNANFPGGAIHATRSQNNVKTDSAVLALMGWTARVPSQNRIEDVVFNRVVGDIPTKESKGSLKLQNIKKDKLTTSLPEFRTLVFLALRKVDTSKPTLVEKALSTAPLDWKSQEVVSGFVAQDILPVVDLTQLTYAFKTSLLDPKSKTSLVHYQNARNRFVSSTANKPLFDSKAKKFDSVFDVPAPVLDQFRKRFCYPIQKRKATEDTPMGESFDTDQPKLTVYDDTEALESLASAPPKKIALKLSPSKKQKK